MRQYDVTYSLGDGLARVPRRCVRCGAAPELRRWASSCIARVTPVCKAMVEGPDTAARSDRVQHAATAARCADDAPLLRAGSDSSRCVPWLRPITSALGATEAARAGAAMLCYVTPKEHVGLPNTRGRERRLHLPTRSRPTRRHRPWHRRCRGNGTTISRGHGPALNWQRSSRWLRRRDRACAARRGSRSRPDFCAMCGHDWCRMRISKEIVAFESGKGIRRSSRCGEPWQPWCQQRRGAQVACQTPRHPSGPKAACRATRSSRPSGSRAGSAAELTTPQQVGLPFRHPRVGGDPSASKDR